MPRLATSRVPSSAAQPGRGPESLTPKPQHTIQARKSTWNPKPSTAKNTTKAKVLLVPNMGPIFMKGPMCRKEPARRFSTSLTRAAAAGPSFQEAAPGGLRKIGRHLVSAAHASKVDPTVPLYEPLILNPCKTLFSGLLSYSAVVGSSSRSSNSSSRSSTSSSGRRSSSSSNNHSGSSGRSEKIAVVAV